MKKHLFTITILFCTIYVHAQSWQWARSAGVTGGNEYATATATDASGNVYVAGDFNTSNLDFGGTILTNSGGQDFFLVKYDFNGNVLWAKKVGGTKDDIVNGICVDNSGNVIITGEFKSTVITFSTTPPLSLTLTSANFSDIFIAKYDPSGAALWAKKGGGTGDDGSIAVCTDDSDNVFITGSFNSPTIAFGANPITRSGSVDALIVKMDLYGNFLWGQHSSGTNSDGEGRGICTDANGNVFVTGIYQNANIVFGGVTLINAGLTDVFVAKYTATGIPVWGKSAGNIDREQSNGICTDMTGNIFITGYFLSSSLTFGSNTLTNTNISTFDIFVAKYDGGGTELWAKSAGGSGNDEGMSITKDAIGNVYIGGLFNSTVTFGSTTLTSAGSDDFFIARYNSTGTAGYAKAGGGAGSDAALSISVDPYNNAYLAGGFLSTSFVLGSTTLTNTDVGDTVADVFVTKLNSVNAIDDSQTPDLISVYPNPSAGQFEINLPAGTTSLQVSDAIGNIIQSKDIKGETNFVFHLSENGVYLVKAFSDKQVVTQKILVNN